MSIRSCKGDFQNVESSRAASWLMSVWDATATRKKASPDFIYACDLSLVVGKKKRKKQQKKYGGRQSPRILPSESRRVNSTRSTVAADF